MKKIITIISILISVAGCSNSSESEVDPKIEAAVLDLTKKEIMASMNRSRDTVFTNDSSKKKITFICFGGITGHYCNNGYLHKYLISHLPEKYIGDTSINIRTTGLKIGFTQYIDYKTPWWHLNYSLWHNGEIIMSENQDLIISVNNYGTFDFNGVDISQLPDMTKYGYK